MALQTPANLPQRGNRLTRAFGRFGLSLLGWTTQGTLPDRRKMVAIVAPHTSNWDFVVGILVVFALGIRAHWIGKHTLFFPPLGRLMKWLGGIPVNRSVPNQLITATTQRFESERKFLLGIAPEGTRRRVDTWKRGFYHIATGANVPILCAGLDYRTRSIVFGPLILPSGDFDTDFRTIEAFFSTITACRPEKFNLSSRQDRDDRQNDR